MSIDAGTPLLGRVFDDLDEGQEVSTRGRTITEADLVAFSGLTGDWHPLHSDATWAAASPFGERLAHGMLVLSYALGLVAFDPEIVVALRGISAATFKAPVRVGDTIHAEVMIDRLRPLDHSKGLVELACRIVNQEGRTAARCTVTVVWRRSRRS
jgi:acyl dehydratase